MAENATIGALRVVLGLDTAKFEEGVKRAAGSANSFAKQMSAVAAGVQIQRIVERLALSFYDLAKSAVNTADELHRASQRMGVPVEQLSGLKYAADLADVSFEQLSKSFVIMSKNMNAAAAGQITPATAALQALGFNLQQFGKLTPEEAFTKIAEKFAQMEDGATKTAMAVAIFGKSGAELIPFLNEGAAGLAKMTAEGRKLGQIFTGEAAAAADQFKDNIFRLGSVFTGIVNQVTVHFLPALAQMTDDMVDFAKSNDIVTKAADGIIRAFQLVGDNLRLLGELFAIFIGAKIATTLISIVVGFGGLAKAIAQTGIVMSALNAVKRVTVMQLALLAGAVLYATGLIPEFTEQMKKLGGAIGGLLPEGTGENIKKFTQTLGFDFSALTKTITTFDETGQHAVNTLKNMPPPGAFSPEAVKKAQNFSDSIAKIRLETMELKGSFDHLAPGFVSAAQGMGLIKTEADLAALAAGRLTAQQQMLNQVLLQKAGAEAAQAALEPWEKHNKQIEHYQMLAANGVISADTLGKAIQKSAEQAGVSWTQVTSQMAGDLAQGLGEFAKQNKKFAFAAKAAAIAQATINTYMAATKALASFPPPLSYIAAAAAVVAGLGYVARIQSQEAFATGGSFRVAGGLTGVDSQMVAFSATPGEIVDVRRPGQQSAAGGVQTIELRTPRARDFFAENVRALVDTLNAAAPDGYIIRMPAS